MILDNFYEAKCGPRDRTSLQQGFMPVQTYAPTIGLTTTYHSAEQNSLSYPGNILKNISGFFYLSGWCRFLYFLLPSLFLVYLYIHVSSQLEIGITNEVMHIQTS
jgi:hypothetical protein